MIAAWRRLPVLIRAPLAAFVVLLIGSTVGVAPLLANTRFHAEVPWALPVTAIVMALFWRYFAVGSGFPPATRALRRDATRQNALRASIWRAAAAPILLSVVMATSLRLALPSLVRVDAPQLAIDLGTLPLATTMGLLLSIAIAAGVTEEVAFRGYLQKPLEDAYGIAVALAVTSTAFWLAHTDKVSWSHVPFHLTASIALGLLAYFTRSLVPGIVAHVAGDAVLQPLYAFARPQFAWAALVATPIPDPLHALNPLALVEPSRTQAFTIFAWVFLVSAALSVVAFVRLARGSRPAQG